MDNPAGYPFTIPMSETPEQIPAGDVQPPAEDKTDAQRVELLEAKNRQLISEKQAVKKQVDDMQRQLADLQNNQQKPSNHSLLKLVSSKRFGQKQLPRFHLCRMKLQDSSNSLMTRRLPFNSSRSEQPH